MSLLTRIATKEQDVFFPYGGVLASTMTRSCHCGQDIGSWVEELCGHLKAMADHGMTSASIMICWDMVEFVQDKYDFEHYDPLVEKAEKLGLKLALWLWEDITPDWVVKEHPDWLYEADDGTMSPDCSMYHPSSRQKIRDFLEQCVLRYKDSKALYMWNLAPEPFYGVPYRGRALSEKNYEKIYCYNPATIAELGRCKKIIWSDPWLASRTTANAARDFTPDRKLAEVFGCQQKIVRPIVADTQFNRQNSWRNRAIIDKGCCRVAVDGSEFCFESNCYEVELEAKGDAVVAGAFGNGVAGVICNRVENSELFYSGSFFSLPYADPNSDVFVNFKSGGEYEGLIGYFASLLSKAGIVAPVEPAFVCDSDVESKILLGQDKIFVVLINHGPKKSKGTWRIRTEFDVSDASQLFDVLTEQKLEFNIATCRLVEVDIEIERDGVKVLLLSGK